MKLFEWKSESFGRESKRTSEFVNYLAGVWQSRNLFIEAAQEISEEEQHEERIQKQRFFDFTIDEQISARNYVGVVQYDDIRIEVYPKIFSGDQPGNEKKYHLNLLYWLSYCRKIRFPFSFADLSKLEFDDFLELLIYVFAHYTEETISKQPFQAYQTIEEETTFLRGRLSFENYTKHNLLTGKWQNFYCTHEPIIYDNLFNRILKYVATRLLAISRSAQNKDKLSEILFLLHDVADTRCSAVDCDKVRLNPLFENHRQILQLSKLYLSNQVIDLDTDDNRNFCFLIPMEYVFEDFIFGFINDKWPSLNARSQSSAWLASANGHEVFHVRNDILISDSLIIDTKYKIREDNGLKAGVSQEDVYQMLSYAVARNCRDVMLLYPSAKSGLKEPSHFKIASEMFTGDVNLHVRSLDITFDDVAQADEWIKKRFEEIGLFNDGGELKQATFELN